MKRRLFTSLSALSLLLCVLTTVMWVKSYWLAVGVHRVHLKPSANQLNYGGTYLFSDSGGLWLGGNDFVSADPQTIQSTTVEMAKMPSFNYGFQMPGQRRGHLSSTTLGFGWRPREAGRTRSPNTTVTTWEARIPYWPLVLASSLAPAAWVLGRRQRRATERIAKGLCPMCGYDLRATPGRCPECGLEVRGAVG